jgi:hypothetical protein
MAKEWSKEQVAAINTWIQDKWLGRGKCSQCDAKEWLIADAPAHLIVGDTDGATLMGTYYPAVVLICQSCGNIVLLHAGAMGLRTADTEVPDGQ